VRLLTPTNVGLAWDTYTITPGVRVAAGSGTGASRSAAGGDG
jgi:hypothetical protein